MPERGWLAFDVGTTGARAALLTPDGHVLRSAHREYPTRTAVGGVIEQDAGDWWQAVRDATAELDAGGAVAAIAVTGQMQDLILISGQGRPVRPVILYSDTRSRAEAAEIDELLGAGVLRKLTGNDQDSGSLPAKLRWLNRHEPASLADAEHLLLGAADFVAWRMTGHARTDSTTASSTGLMDVGTRGPLDPQWFERLGIGRCRSLIPPIHPGGTQAGVLTDCAAAELNLPAGLPVHLGPGDAGAATLGAGSGEPGQAYLYVGTSGWVAFSTDNAESPDTGVLTLAHPRSGRVIEFAALLTAGGNLEWIRGVFGTDDYPALIAAALEREPSGLLYLPYLNGERSPFRDPLARGAFIGLDSQTVKADLYRAVLEGVAFAYRHAIEALIPTPPRTLALTGGATRSAPWCQLFADIIGVPVTVAPDAEWVGPRGAVIAARVARGDTAHYGIDEHAGDTVTLTPRATNRAQFDGRYAMFRQAYPRLAPLFRPDEGQTR